MTADQAQIAHIGAAYRHCEQVTRAQARNFSYGIALLPGDKRRALSAVYAYARSIDDIGDGTLPAADKLAALADARKRVTGLCERGLAASGGDPVLVALADAADRFEIPLAAFGELIDGCEADVRGVTYSTFDELEHYCRCVAGSIGRLSLGVFGTSDMTAAAPLADDLGVALQLTNILRDIREDLGNGRVYLPADDLRRFGCSLSADRPDELRAGGGLERLVLFEAQRARGWYATGMRLMPLLDRRSAASAKAMAGIYRRLLEHISAAPAAALRSRLSLPTREKALVAASCLAGMARRPGPAAAAGAGRAGRARNLARCARRPAMTARHVVVIGGGLAGISAAIELREAGIEVTLLEARPWLGGATCSFSRGGLMIDNGQHVFLRCCTAYRGLLARLGVTGRVAIQDRFDVTVLAPGRQARLRRTRLPGPLHMIRALARYTFLSPMDRLRVARAALALRFAKPASPGLDRASLGDWFGARGQRASGRRRLWDLFIVSTLNIAGDEANVGLAATVIKTALLGRKDAADIGVPTVPLGELHGKAAADLLGRLGADVRLRAKAVAVEQDAAGGFRVLAVSAADRSDPRRPAEHGGQQTPAEGPDQLPSSADGASSGTRRLSLDALSAAAHSGSDLASAGESGAGGRVLCADGVILAVPGWAAARLVPAAESAAAGRWAELGTSPIVNVHVIYDRRVTRLPFAAAVDSPVQWVFDKTRQARLQAGQYLAVSLSAADGYADVPSASLREKFLPALAELFPAARDAQVTDFFVTRERRATFRQAPGCGAMRPGAATSLRGFVLAGAWTDTGWPDTMEGAVRSGLTAAQEMKRALAGAPPPGAARAGTRAAAAPSAGGFGPVGAGVGVFGAAGVGAAGLPGSAANADTAAGAPS